VAPAREVAVLPGGGGEAPDQLRAQVLGLDHVVDHELAGQPQDVDVGLVLGPQPLGQLVPLTLVGYRRPAGCSRRR